MPCVYLVRARYIGTYIIVSIRYPPCKYLVNTWLCTNIYYVLLSNIVHITVHGNWLHFLIKSAFKVQTSTDFRNKMASTKIDSASSSCLKFVFVYIFFFLFYLPIF